MCTVTSAQTTARHANRWLLEGRGQVMIPQLEHVGAESSPVAINADN